MYRRDEKTVAFTQPDLVMFTGQLKKMNLSSAALFPGLEGFAKSLGERILHFRQLAGLGTGHPNHKSKDRGA